MRISALAHAADETPRTLRFYETAGVLTPPPRTPSGHRDYDSGAIDQVRFIRSLQQAGLTLSEIAALTDIRDKIEPPNFSDARVLASATARVEHQLAIITRLSADLAFLAHDAVPGGRPGDSAATPDNPPSIPTATVDC